VRELKAAHPQLRPQPHVQVRRQARHWSAAPGHGNPADGNPATTVKPASQDVTPARVPTSDCQGCDRRAGRRP